MSLTAHLLFNKATELPRGKKITHRMDSWWKNNTPESVYARECCALEKAANIEKVFSAISQGGSTALEIESSVGLSLATVRKALHELEDWHDGPRIVRIRGGKSHRFEVVK